LLTSLLPSNNGAPTVRVIITVSFSVLPKEDADPTDLYRVCSFLIEVGKVSVRSKLAFSLEPIIRRSSWRQFQGWIEGKTGSGLRKIWAFLKSLFGRSEPVDTLPYQISLARLTQLQSSIHYVNDGDGFEQLYWPLFKERIPNIELFWQRFIVPMTKRIELGLHEQGRIRHDSQITH
jgi:hypothetical protein